MNEAMNEQDKHQFRLWFGRVNGDNSALGWCMIICTVVLFLVTVIDGCNTREHIDKLEKKLQGRMTPMTLFDTAVDELDRHESRIRATPRDYQTESLRNAFDLWDEGTIGELCRAFTGGGKTLVTCMKIEKWLDRGAKHRAMVISYEQELVEQFAEEIQDWLDIEVGIEMGSNTVDPKWMPRIIVVSRQSLLRHTPATVEQRDYFEKYGIKDINLLTRNRARTLIKHLKNGVEAWEVEKAIAEFHESPYANEAAEGYSRLHKFDWHINWLVCFDEAHHHAYKLKSVGHIVDWFDQNPKSRRSGMTATPKRGDNLSIGHKMFPGVSLDYPLFTAAGPCAVNDGWAVPYKQQYINVKDVDFKRLRKVGDDFATDELQELLNTERNLAGMCEPMLDLVGERRTLIFSPGVDMAKSVSEYLNARCRCECSCGTIQWQPRSLIGDGAKCRDCQAFLEDANVIFEGQVSRCVHGTVPRNERKNTYEAHKANDFQFLSVCNLCREGYNCREIAAVAVFRPVSRKASSLAEQMKGRGSRPLEGVVDGGKTKEERLAAIAASDKPDCIAKGTPVLTDCGLVPVESVSTDMKLWDGVEWVSHAGVISHGIRNVITYAGITATPDHKVATHDEENQSSQTQMWATLGDCATQQTAICITGIEGQAVRKADGCHRTTPASNLRPHRQRRPLRAGKLAVCDKPTQLLQHEKEPHRPEDARISISSSRGDVLRQHAFATFASRSDVERSRQAEPEAGDTTTRPTERQIEVFDIINAGPRHRFTAAGLLVSNCLIIDLVGITGLADCATTMQIYGEGLPDEVLERAEEIALEGGVDVIEVLKQAEHEVKEEQERRRLKRLHQQQQAEEAARRRSELAPHVEYEVSSVSYERNQATQEPIYRDGNRLASDKQLGFIWYLGIKNINEYDRPTIAKAGKIINDLKSGMTTEEAVYCNGMKRKVDAFIKRIEAAKSNHALTQIGRELRDEQAKRRVTKGDNKQIIEAGHKRRTELQGTS